MKLSKSIAFLVLVGSLVYHGAALGQPVYSPEVRSQKELQWMQDSLHINQEQAKKINAISLNYQQSMDKAGQISNLHTRDKSQKRLMQKKDTDLKGILNAAQYQKYYKREKQVRQQAKVKYPADRQPL